MMCILSRVWRARRGGAGAGLTLTPTLTLTPALPLTRTLTQELAEATEPDHVAAEAADLMYFAMARCVAAGVSLAQVGSHLDRRALKLARRPGNAKASRIAEGDKILAAAKSEGAPPAAATAPEASGGVTLTRLLVVAAAAAAGAVAVARTRA